MHEQLLIAVVVDATAKAIDGHADHTTVHQLVESVATVDGAKRHGDSILSRWTLQTQGQHLAKAQQSRIIDHAEQTVDAAGVGFASEPIEPQRDAGIADMGDGLQRRLAAETVDKLGLIRGRDARTHLQAVECVQLQQHGTFRHLVAGCHVDPADDAVIRRADGRAVKLQLEFVQPGAGAGKARFQRAQATRMIGQTHFAITDR